MKNYMVTFCCFLLIFTFCVPSLANAELLITPTRVILKDRDRFAIVTLVNTSNELKTYEIGFNYNRMREDGSIYDSVEKSVTDFDLGKHLNYTPRRISLAPGAKQRIRLALRRPAEPIPPGDYRVHLVFSSVPNDEKELNPIEKSDKKAAGAVVKIYVGFSIPVILRVGEPEVKASIEQISFGRADNNAMQVYVPVIREGKPYPIIGEMYVYHIGNDGKEELVGEISNAHVFPEVNKRVFKVTLNKEIKGGSLKVVLRNYDRDDRFVYAEKIFPIQN